MLLYPNKLHVLHLFSAVMISSTDLKKKESHDFSLHKMKGNKTLFSEEQKEVCLPQTVKKYNWESIWSHVTRRKFEQDLISP